MTNSNVEFENFNIIKETFWNICIKLPTLQMQQNNILKDVVDFVKMFTDNMQMDVFITNKHYFKKVIGLL